MANALAAIMSTINHTIPREILEIAFQTDRYQLTLDERIRAEVVEGRVLIDTNLIAGKRAEIPLLDAWRELTIPAVTNPLSGLMREAEIYRIPANVRENREISTVTRLILPGLYSDGAVTGVGGLTAGYGNSVHNLSQLAIGSRTMNDAAVLPTATLLGRNMIRVTPRIANTAGYVLECLLNFDSNYTNIAPAAIPALRDLVVCATKAYIWTASVIRIDNGEMIAGQQLGVYKRLVDNYESANEQYNELLEKFQGAAMFDPELIKTLIYAGL